MGIQKPLGLEGPPPTRGRADVVFVVDASGSMMTVINDLKDRLTDFVEGVGSNEQVAVDWRVASLGQDSRRFYLNDFTSEAREFATGLTRIKAGGDEFTLPAIDWAADMPWRDRAHRFIVVLSDEAVETGADVDWQIASLDELMDKLHVLHIKLMIFAPASDAFERMASNSGVMYKAIREDTELLSAELGDLMKSIGKTVSTYVGKGLQGVDGLGAVKKDIYGLKGRIKEL